MVTRNPPGPVVLVEQLWTKQAQCAVGIRRAAKIVVDISPLFLPLERSNSISFRQNPFKLSEVSDSSTIAREPTPFGQENSHSRDI